MTTEQINAAAEDSAGGLRDRPDAESNYERSEHIAGFKSGVKWAVASAAPQWVPVSEGLPEANEGGHFSEDVLMHFEGLAPTVGYYDYRDGYKEFQSYDDSYSGYIPSHWQVMTRPATPQQESHE